MCLLSDVLFKLSLSLSRLSFAYRGKHLITFQLFPQKYFVTVSQEMTQGSVSYRTQKVSLEIISIPVDINCL